MDKLLVFIAYWLALILLVLILVFMLIYIAASGFCAYRKVTETKSKSEFELLGQADVAKEPQSVHSPVN